MKQMMKIKIEKLKEKNKELIVILKKEENNLKQEKIKKHLEGGIF